jgi:hypothetical protein
MYDRKGGIGVGVGRTNDGVGVGPAGVGVGVGVATGVGPGGVGLGRFAGGGTQAATRIAISAMDARRGNVRGLVMLAHRDA